MALSKPSGSTARLSTSAVSAPPAMPSKRASRSSNVEVNEKKPRRHPPCARNARRAPNVDAEPRVETSPDVLGRVLGALSLEDFETGGVRTTHDLPSLPGPHVAAVDVVKIATRSGRSNSEKRWKRLKEEHPELVTGSHKFKFAGRGRGNVEVVSVTKAVEIIMLLPGKAAAEVRLKASVLLVRFLGGDLALVAELYDMNSLQAHLKEHWPEHPLARFGEAAASDSLAPTGNRETSPGPASAPPPAPAELVQQVSELTTRTVCRTVAEVFVAKFDELLRRMAAEHAAWQVETLRKLDATLGELRREPARQSPGQTDAIVIDVEEKAPTEDLRGRAPVKVGQFMHEQWCDSWTEAGVNVKSYLLQFSMLLKAKTTQCAGRR